MFEDLFFNFLESEENKDNNYPDYFYLWDDALSENTTHDSLEPEELKDIINIYFSEEELEKARITIDYTLSTYQDEEDILYDIMVILSDYEKWNDLLKLAEQLKDRNEFWVDAHKIEALLHLSMEEEAFQTFQTAKTKYAKETESMSILYLAMGESLLEMDLFESCIDVISEAIDKFGPQIDFYWLQIEANATINDIEEVYSLAEKISELIPFDASSWQRLGLIYKQINDTSKAIEAFEFARNLEYEDKQRNLLELIFAY
ncbi:hypothetical protein LJC06_04225, partial [Bacteroidales bacterium OttesenSCG-928-I14]|nr:hypothetical protein [Bacteroidales bacterium OttesenSCG-928-I14]